MISRLLCCFSAFLILTALANADTTGGEKDDPIVLGAFVVTAKSRGIIPLNGWFRYSRLTGNAKSPIAISGPMQPGKTLGFYGVEKDEQIVAVAGQRIVGMDRHALVRLWMETGEAGDPVKLTIRGTGENSSVFREITVKRIAPPKSAAR